MKTLTLEQAWHDTFPFLTENNEFAPFAVALLAARSRRHLEEILRWFPPNWQLPRSDKKRLFAFWEEWYKPHRTSGGTSDHLVRSTLEKLTNAGAGLVNYYMFLLSDRHGAVPREDREENKSQGRYSLLYKWVDQDGRPIPVRGRFMGHLLTTNVRATVCAEGWKDISFQIWALENVSVQGEELVHHLVTLLPQAKGCGWMGSVFTIVYDLPDDRFQDVIESVPYVSRTIPGNPELLKPQPSEGFEERLDQVLSQMGIPIDIVNRSPET